MTMAEKIVVLREGVTEQIGTPIELYARPRNRFVAGFLGAPQMNMLAGKITAVGAAGAKISVADGRGAVSAAVAATSGMVGKDCTVGIRPEHLIPSDRGDLRVMVDAIEMLGADTIVYARAQSGERVVASLRGIHPIGQGSTVSYGVDPRFVHAFNQAGDALPPLRPWSDDYIADATPTVSVAAAR